MSSVLSGPGWVGFGRAAMRSRTQFYSIIGLLLGGLIGGSALGVGLAALAHFVSYSAWVELSAAIAGAASFLALIAPRSWRRWTNRRSRQVRGEIALAGRPTFTGLIWGAQLASAVMTNSVTPALWLWICVSCLVLAPEAALVAGVTYGIARTASIAVSIRLKESRSTRTRHPVGTGIGALMRAPLTAASAVVVVAAWIRLI